MRKIFKVFLLITIIIIYFFKCFQIFAFELFPQPGINCGVGTNSAVLDFNNEEFKKYRCCYSDLEKMNFYFYNPFEDNKELDPLKIFINFLNKSIYNFPFLIWFFPQVERPITLGKIIDSIKEYFSLKRCGSGSTPFGTVGIDCYCKLNINYNLASLKSLCDLVSDKESCYQCIGFDPETNWFGEGGVYTSIGCIKNSLSSFIKENLFRWGIGLAGTVTLFCIIYAVFNLQTSAGNAEKIKKAQELLTSCIMGLMLIIFSVFILRLIGVDILKIPGFGKS